MRKAFSRKTVQVTIAKPVNLSQAEAIPLDVLISRRAKHYRGVADWDKWYQVQKVYWR